MHIKLGMGLLFLLVSIIAVVVAATLMTRNSKNGERLRLIKQGTSGRWLLTVGAMISFLGLSLGVFVILVSLRHKLEPETAVALFTAVLLISQGVYKDYFRRDAGLQE
jgi:hypothetical protein